MLEQLNRLLQRLLEWVEKKSMEALDNLSLLCGFGASFKTIAGWRVEQGHHLLYLHTPLLLQAGVG